MVMKRTLGFWQKTISVMLCVAFFTNAVVAGIPQLSESRESCQAVIDQCEINPPENPSQCFSLALAYFGSGNFRKAVDWANRAIPGFPERKQKSICYHLIAQSYGALGEYEYAAEAAKDGQRCDPESIELACLRMEYCEQINDSLDYKIAEEHLKRLDPTFKKDPKSFGPIIIIITVSTIVRVLLKYAHDDPKVNQYFDEAYFTLLRLATIYML